MTNHPQGTPRAWQTAALVLPALCCFGWFAASARAQPQPPVSPVFSEVLEVRVVNIEVVVTDRDGTRVSGLGPSAFRLLVDGRETKIDYFSEIQDGRSVAVPGAQVLSVPQAAAGGAVGTSYLIFIDDFFAIARDRDRVLDALAEQLAGLGPEDRAAIVAFDGKQLTMLSTWTNSARELARALEQARLRPALGIQRLSELRLNDQERRARRDMRLLQAERSAAIGGDPPPDQLIRTRLEGPDLDFATRLTNQVERSVMAAVSTLRSFANPPGRKVMLLLSGGWPFAPAEYTINDFSAEPQDAITSGATNEDSGKARDKLLEPLATTANLLGYTLYPVDVPGLWRDDTTDASLGASDLITGAARSQNNPATALPREQHHHAALDFIADRTGGRSLINAQRDDALRAAISDPRTYYWLGFSPERRENDVAHEIEVEVVGRKDLRVRARAGFVDLSRAAEVTMLVESALLVGDPPTAKPLQAKFGAPRGGNKMRIPLEVGIPLDDITLLPTAGRYRSQLEIRITVMDEDGNRSETNVDRIDIDGAKPPRPGQLFYYETELTLRKRKHRIVIAVFDPISGTILSSSGEIGPG